MPDPILINILTILRAREAVQICQLSKRWIDLWTYLPSLNFDDDEFGGDEVIFERFVNSFLPLRKTSLLDTFQLKWHNNEEEIIDSKSVISWILYSVKCKPRVLSVYCPSYNRMNFPYSIFCCTSLEEVKLYLGVPMIGKFITPRSVNLPLLRKLSLGLIEVIREFMEKILLGCPLLALKLENCFLYAMEIYSPLLKHLTIVSCHSVAMFISCPGLLNLDIIKMYSCEIRFGNLTSLENTSIDLPCKGMHCCEILSSLSNATEMKLSDHIGKGAAQLLNIQELKAAGT